MEEHVHVWICHSQLQYLKVGNKWIKIMDQKQLSKCWEKNKQKSMLIYLYIIKAFLTKATALLGTPITAMKNDNIFRVISQTCGCFMQWHTYHGVTLPFQIQSKHKKLVLKKRPDYVNNSLHRPVSSAGQHVIGVVRWEPPFISVSSSWARDTSRILNGDHWSPRVTPLMPAITAPHTTTTIFFIHNHKLPRPLTHCTPVIAGWGYKPWFG